MFVTKFAAFALAALPFASAYIQTVANFTGTYDAKTHDSIDVAFIFGSTRVDYVDLTATIALGVPGEKGATIGTPILNLDLTSAPANTGVPSFNVSVPLSKAAFYAGSGPYVLNVIIGSADGFLPDLIYRSAQYKIGPFKAAL